jgi:ligand-binding SRPBCC domain-containing protein
MSVHVLRARQIVPAGLETCWSFFSDPANLRKLTPSSLDLRLTEEPPPSIYPGLMIQYQVRPLFGVPMTWLTEITHVRSMEYFADEQRVGPYAIWHHEHFFAPLEGGRTEVRDLVHYRLPLGWLGDLFHPVLVLPQLREIFAFREKAITEHFGVA